MASGGSGRSERFVGQPGDLIPWAEKNTVEAFIDTCSAVGNPNQDTIKQTLKKELNENPNYKNVWDAATANYKKGKITYNEYLPKDLPEECYIAVIAYTMETPKIYKDFNDESRKLSKSNWAEFPYKSMWYYLTLAVPKIKGNSFTTKTTCYRGVDFHFTPNDYKKPIFSIPFFYREPDVTIFKSFTSVSLNRSVAENFLNNAEKPCLIIIEGVPMAGNSLKKLTQFPLEEEVLLYPWNCFLIIRLETEGSRQTMLLEHAGWRDMDRSGNLPYTIEKPIQYDML